MDIKANQGVYIDTTYRAIYNKDNLQELSPTDLKELYKGPSFLPHITYTLEDKLSPAKYADLFLFLQSQEILMIQENGFVVTDRLWRGGTEIMNFVETLYRLYSADKNIFISTDMIIHAWHMTFDNMLMDIEKQSFVDTLWEIFGSLCSVIPKMWTTYQNSDLLPCVQDAIQFIAVATALMLNKPVDEKNFFDYFAKSKKGEEKIVPKILTDFIPQELVNEQEVNKIKAQIQSASGLESMNFCGRSIMMDYSQFTPRAHYTKSDLLKYYFKVMVWCATNEFCITPCSDMRINETQSVRELGTSLVLLHMMKLVDKIELWKSFDKVVQLFIGKSDNMNFEQLNSILPNGFELKDLNSVIQVQQIIIPTYYGVQAYGSSYAVSPYDIATPITANIPRIFSFMGQRFCIDSWAMSKFIADQIIYKNTKIDRKLVSGLDVAFSVLANDSVAPVLVDRMTRPEATSRDGLPFHANLIAARKAVDSQHENFWNDSIYSMWLNALRQLSSPTTGPEFPECMRTKAWAMKDVNTQMGSWAALRHDTVLYTKSPRVMEVGCDYPRGYVEPRMEFWQAMQLMVKKTATILSTIQLPNLQYRKAPPKVDLEVPAFLKSGLNFTNMETVLTRFDEILSILIEITKKELAHIALTTEESYWLRRAVEGIVGSSGIGSWSGWYFDLFYPSCNIGGNSDTIVADILTAYPAGSFPGAIAQVGLGEVDVIALVVENVGAKEGPETIKSESEKTEKKNDKQVINPSHKIEGVEEKADKVDVFYGPLLSFHEFSMKGLKRLTDEEWGKMVDKQHTQRPPWAFEFLVHTPPNK